ncbi:MAG: type IV secretion system DNA-binding domain-containing protein [Candidatus Woesebacteria bacterium]
MPENVSITFEVRNHRESLEGAAAAGQLFASLPATPTGLLNLFSHAPSITIEFFSQGQTIYTFLTVPKPLEHYIHAQLTSSYPEALITPLAHNPLDEFKKELPKAIYPVRLSAPSYLPLQTIMANPSADTLSALFSTLSKLMPEESAIVQFSIRKAKNSWKQTGYRVANRAATAESTPHPHKEAILKKIGQPGFDVDLRILAQSATIERSKQIAKEIGHSLSIFSSESNSLVIKSPLLGKDRLVKLTVNRVPQYGKLYLSQEELSLLCHLPNKLTASVRNIAWGKSLRGEPPDTLPTFTSVPEAERNDVNLFAKTELKNTQAIFGIKREDRRRHMYAIGKSGTGKSTLLANMIINDLKHDEGIAVIDPHGDLIDTIMDYIPKHRINDVIYLDPADPVAVVKINLFEGGTEVHRELIASGIVAIFQKMYANSWGPRLEYILRNTLLTLLSREAKLEDVLKMLTNEKYRDRVVAELQDEVLKNFWEKEFNPMQERLRTEAISPILNKVGQFVTSPIIRDVVNVQHSSINIEDIMDQGKILLINVSQGKLGEDNAALLGAMLITKIQLAAMNRVYKAEADRKDFYLYIDEFQNFATTSFIKILSEARKYRLNLILANQYMEQIPPEVKSAIFGNAGTIASFILGAADAAQLQQEYGNMYTQDDLVSLSRYQIITKLMIDGTVSRPFPATTLSLAASKNQNREKVLRASREQYAKKKVM